MKFEEAIEAVKKGELIYREDWGQKDMFIFMRPYDNIDISIIPNIKSLPQKVKDYFVKQFANNETHFVSGNPIQIHFCEYLCMKDTLGNIVNGWLPNQMDILADDWLIKTYEISN